MFAFILLHRDGERLYFANFTLASDSIGSTFLRGRVTLGDETTFLHVNTLTRLPETTSWERFNMIG